MFSSRVPNTLLLRVKKPSRFPSRNISAERRAIGNREVVGPGNNALLQYVDLKEYPFPAIRYKEIKGDLIPLREKEKGNWKSLTVDEKKALYRASFCQTFSEIQAPNGRWKQSTGIVLMAISLALWMMMGLKKFMKRPEADTLSEEKRAAQLRRWLLLRSDPITGYSSKWDYEKDEWKK